MKKLLLTLIVFVQPLFCADLLALTMGEAINVAGRQRMLSQRIAQSYLLVGIHKTSGRGETLLGRSIVEFERNLTTLENYDKLKPLAQSLGVVRKDWNAYKVLVSGPVSKENAKRVLALSNAILKEAHGYVQNLNRFANNATAEIIDISGKQRMLSQRIAKNYLASYWGVLDDGDKSQLYQDLAEYESTLKFLETQDVNTQEISEKLAKVSGHFSYASKGFEGDMKMSGGRLVHVVTGTTDAMLKYMNDVTRMYAALLN